MYQLKSVLSRPNSLTFVSGATDEARTFLITAIGNSLAELGVKRKVRGFDLHRPDDFVPISGVAYVPQPDDLPGTRSLIRDRWHIVEDTSSTVLVFNRVWTTIPDMRSKVVGLARENNVLVADDFASSGLKALLGVSSQVSHITLGSDGKRRIKLHFEYFE
jgi:hypothetical protein